jgi:hypothetical protein
MSTNDVWARLGGDFKPGIDVVLSVPFDPRRVAVVGPPVEERIVTTGRRGAQGSDDARIEHEESARVRADGVGQ